MVLETGLWITMSEWYFNFVLCLGLSVRLQRVYSRNKYKISQLKQISRSSKILKLCFYKRSKNCIGHQIQFSWVKFIFAKLANEVIAISLYYKTYSFKCYDWIGNNIHVLLQVLTNTTCNIKRNVLYWFNFES